jgi:hypothetical protein
MEHQFSVGLCFHVYDIKWGMPGFVYPKKDGSDISTDDLRKINKWNERTHHYPILT